MSSQPAQSEFRRACAQWATGIAVVTVSDRGGTPHGMTVNSFTSVSLDPMLILVCIDHRAAILPYLALGSPIALNILAEEQAEISSRFAGKTEDRFEHLEWTGGESGSPLLPGTLAAFETRIIESIPSGDHQIVIAQVSKIHFRGGRPLLYFDSSYAALA